MELKAITNVCDPLIVYWRDEIFIFSTQIVLRLENAEILVFRSC